MKQRVINPSVSTFADHEIIRPPNTLSKAVTRVANDQVPEDDAVARAEAALADLSDQFAGWMKVECERLDRSRKGVEQYGLREGQHAELFRAAHDIRGQAATFGYPFAAKAAESLCRLLEHTPDLSRIPLELIDQHVDGIRAMIRDNSPESRSEIAAALARRLHKVTDEFLRYENRHRPDYLQAIMGPPLQPR